MLGTAALPLRHLRARFRLGGERPISNIFYRTSSTTQSIALGIRKEEKNYWERRVPLTPKHVHALVDSGIRVVVEPSPKRIYSEVLYEKAGATISSDLSDCDVIIGVKEVPIPKLLSDKTYMFFSHTHKGQVHNMPLLRTMMDRRITLIDYELLKNPTTGSRYVLFSHFAGIAGMIDGLHCFGRRLLAREQATPFLSVGMSYQYPSIKEAFETVKKVGERIAEGGALPRSLVPVVFTFTGNGNVTKGALEVFKHLPCEWIAPNDLSSFVTSNSHDPRKVYACQVMAKDYAVRKRKESGHSEFNVKDFYKHPHLYTSNFHEKIVPYTSFLVNGIYWDKQFPRILTTEQMNTLSHGSQLPKLVTIADISCDINGPIEFMHRASTITDPFYVLDTKTGKESSDASAPGVQIMSIDNLPCEFPQEASDSFSKSLLPWIEELCLYKAGKRELSSVIREAVILDQGNLPSKHAHLAKSVRIHGTSKEKNVLILGSGFVAAPLVDYLVARPSTTVTVASNSLQEASALLSAFPDSSKNSAVQLDIKDEAALDALITKADIVVSFVPAMFHPLIAKRCIALCRDMVTASYISPQLAALSTQAEKAGICIMNECGLDPGIDHLTAVKTFEEVAESGGKIIGFESWCGGLPSPEFADNPLGYKFSWSPKGVLLAACNDASYKKDGKLISIPGRHLLDVPVQVPVAKGFVFEGIPNRDSLKYVDMYKLGELKDLKTMFRGTLRFPGYSEIMNAFKSLGFLSNDAYPFKGECLSWPDLLTRKFRENPQSKSLLTPVVKDAMDWLFYPTGSTIPEPVIAGDAWIDVLCNLLLKKLPYLPGQKDLVVMHHIFDIQHADGKIERRTSTLIAYGDPKGYSAMAKTVGLPAAIATDLILSGQFTRKGVLAPVTKDIYDPMLERLEAFDIAFHEVATFQPK